MLTNRNSSYRSSTSWTNPKCDTHFDAIFRRQIFCISEWRDRKLSRLGICSEEVKRRPTNSEGIFGISQTEVMKKILMTNLERPINTFYSCLKDTFLSVPQSPRSFDNLQILRSRIHLFAIRGKNVKFQNSENPTN